MVDQSTTRIISAGEFLALPESDVPTQLIDGEIVMTPAPLLSHQNSITRLTVVLTALSLVEPDDLFSAPTDVHFDDGNVFQPDIAWLSPQNDQCIRVGDSHLRGAPDLIVEILSPSTEQYDRGKKFQVYETHGVREYWLVNGAGRFVEVYRLQDNAFVRYGLFAEQATFQSPVLNNAKIIVSHLFPTAHK